MRYTEKRVVLSLLLLLLQHSVSNAFFVQHNPRRMPLFTATTPDLETMRVGEMKEELQSYGISTKSFLEKKEIVEALAKARAEGLKPQPRKKKKRRSDNNDSSSSSRQERLAQEMEKCSNMSARELKQELTERGVSTTSFLEKKEYVQALAEARVDGVTKSDTAASSSDEGYAEYADVEVITDNSSGPRPKGQSANSASSRQGGPGMGGMGGMGLEDILKNMGGMGGGGAPGGSPFGGGMGGMADMFKNMGGGGSPFGGGAGGSPFGGGAGGSPFGGDAFAKAQQMMSNPKVQEIMAKAQSNPRIMSKVNECMSNPAAFAKYQNDPDVAELIGELRKYM